MLETPGLWNLSQTLGSSFTYLEPVGQEAGPERWSKVGIFSEKRPSPWRARLLTREHIPHSEWLADNTIWMVAEHRCAAWEKDWGSSKYLVGTGERAAVPHWFLHITGTCHNSNSYLWAEAAAVSQKCFPRMISCDICPSSQSSRSSEKKLWAWS